ncbi:MAG: glycogen synthase [Candidatus Nanopelagicaceae bacterium]|nr:glycogen synthase [Candidatus Nanopelagicaceae bacterium]
MNSGKSLSVALLTREWPPSIYGGAGVHVRNLVEALKDTLKLSTQVHCFGAPRIDATGYELKPPFTEINPALQTLLIDMDMALNIKEANLVHSHTWYANFAGYLASKIYKIPHVVTAHSLEPLRPWKAEQLGGGYVISSWVEQLAYENADAIIAVSDGMRNDVIKSYPQVDPKKIMTIRNGIDTSKFKPTLNSSILDKHGVTTPYALFVGRITRQKGLAHLLRSWKSIPKEYSLVLAAGSPDEPQIGAEVESLISELRKDRENVIWIKEMLPHDELVALLTAARVFVCPSVYEPLGIVNLEAMACETAVVASEVGGIPEVVSENETGLLVEFSSDSKIFEKNLSESILKVLSDESLAARMGIAGRKRAVDFFGWDKVANQTIDVYRSLI